jgi:DNA replication licensing factor MCM6
MVRLSEALARVHCDEKVGNLQSNGVIVSSLFCLQVGVEYVREAVRLLRKSIIHVETGDVILESSKPPSTPLVRNTASSVSGSESESDSTHDPKNKKSHSTGQNGSDSVNDSNVSGNLNDHKDSRAGRQSKQAIRIASSKYFKVQSMLLLHLHDIDGGQTIKELTAWYLDQIKDELKSEDDLHTESKIIKKIIHKLINQDGHIIVIQEPPATTKDPSLRVVTVNPNYVI